jgi:hypothetical protein
MHVVSDVALRGHERGARVQADAQLDVAVSERVGHRLRSGHCAGGGREGEEEGVPLRIHLDAIPRSTRLADDASMLG